MRSSQHAIAVAAAALRESTPSGHRNSHRRGERRAARRTARNAPTPIRIAARSPGSTVSSADGVASWESWRTDRRREAARMSSSSDVVRAWGSANAVPIATRSERRASGSALVWSRIRPSQPSPAALRMIAPTLAGLSTASRTTIRRHRAANSATLGRAGRWNRAMIDCGIPRPDTMRRTSSPPAYTGAPSGAQSPGDVGDALAGRRALRRAGTRRRVPGRRRGHPRRGRARRRRRRACRLGSPGRARSAGTGRTARRRDRRRG